ncbi:MAG TPA: NAD(P)/FAD-dependent oxidoreductase [Acidimicrobiales bacterium]|nr:NAD(P)/FAD-dependent oxidoreductase [Acidimicrobiales bacterium]
MVEELDVVVVGAGLGGMYALHRFRGDGLRVVVFETGDDVGGTWYWNRYPGARCDVESVEYSYGFSEELEQEWEWTERYAGQPEILCYLQHVASRFDLYRDIRFETRVTEAVFDEAGARWRVRTDRGDDVSAQFLVMATGCLSSANLPNIDGIGDFRGLVLHTGRWPREEVDLSATRVGVVGTGSSAIQAIPVIAEVAADLTVFQRTASYTVPAWNRALTPEEVAEIKADYQGLRARNRAMPGALGSRWSFNDQSALEVTDEEREAEFEKRWAIGGFAFVGAFKDTSTDPKANFYAAEFVRRKIREIVHDPATAELLSPRHTISCKRICLDTNYYETFNRPNVHLVDISSTGIERVTATGIVAGATAYELDVIVFATGFDAMTGSLTRIDAKGRQGQSLKDAWAAGPVNYLGLSVPGFPNLFTLTGPGSPSVLANMFVANEQHVDWVADCMRYLRTKGFRTIEATEGAAEDWVAHVNEVAGRTLYPSCNSWYLGANIPGKTRVFMPLPGFPAYVERCDDVAARGYEGFVLAS